jgi:hypothetical protein
VQGDEADIREFGGGGNGACDCIWDVVEFEIEEDFRALARKLSNCLRAFGGEEFAADFEEVGHAAQLLCQFEGWRQAVNIQRDD